MLQKIIHPDPGNPFFQRIFHEILTNQRAWGSADGNPHLDSNPTIATQPHRHRCQMVRSEDAWRGRVVRVPPRRRGAGSGAGMMGTDFTGKNGGTWWCTMFFLLKKWDVFCQQKYGETYIVDVGKLGFCQKRKHCDLSNMNRDSYVIYNCEVRKWFLTLLARIDEI